MRDFIRNHQDTTTEDFARYYVASISFEMFGQPIEDRVSFIKGVIDSMDRRIAEGNKEFKAFRKVFIGMKREAREAAKVAARATYSNEAKA